MARIRWTSAPPADAAAYEDVLRTFAITMCPPRASARRSEDGATEIEIDARPGPGAISYARRSREQHAYLGRVSGRFTLIVHSPEQLRQALEHHYELQDGVQKRLEDSGAA